MNDMNRRSFLQRSTLITAGAALGLHGTAMAASNRDIRKSLKIGMIQERKTVLEKMRLIKEVGFDGLEFNGPFEFEGKTYFDMKEVLKAQDQTGIKVPGLVAGAFGRLFSHADPKEREKGVEGYKQALRDARKLGGTTVLLYPGRVDKDNSYADVYKRVHEGIRKVIPTCEETGVKIAIENVWNQFLLSPLEAADFIDSFESPFVGWYFDVGNVVTYGWPEHWIRTLGHRILKLDIKEFSRKKRDQEGLWQGFKVDLMEGDCDWPTVMKALDEIGYIKGWGSAEVPGGGRERLQFISERMDRIFAL